VISNTALITSGNEVTISPPYRLGIWAGQNRVHIGELALSTTQSDFVQVGELLLGKPGFCLIKITKNEDYLLYKAYKASKNKWVNNKRELKASSDLIGYQRSKTLFRQYTTPSEARGVRSAQIPGLPPYHMQSECQISKSKTKIEDENRAPCRILENPPSVYNYPNHQKDRTTC
jgi:hypothetical protein